MNPSVYLIILNWNGKDLTLDCLESLSTITYNNYEIMVVDNGSGDGSVEAIQSKYPSVKMLQLKSNIGFAGGNNAGFDSIKNDKPDFVIFLNNDTTVDQNFIEPLVKPFLLNKVVGQTVPKIFYADNQQKIWYAGGKVNFWLGLIYHVGIRIADSQKYSVQNQTDYATGCCFCMRFDDFNQLEGFDSSFPMYGEDVDLSLRLQVENKQILYVPESKIYHKVSASIGGNLSLQKLKKKFYGMIKLFGKHANPMQKTTILLSWIILIPIQVLRYIYLRLKNYS